MLIRRVGCGQFKLFKSEILLKRNFVTENTYPRYYEAFSLSLKVTYLSLCTHVNFDVNELLLEHSGCFQTAVLIGAVLNAIKVVQRQIAYTYYGLYY